MQETTRQVQPAAAPTFSNRDLLTVRGKVVLVLDGGADESDDSDDSQTGIPITDGAKNTV